MYTLLGSPRQAKTAERHSLMLGRHPRLFSPLVLDFDDNALSCMMVIVSYGDYYDLKFLVVLFMFHDNFDDNDLVDHQSS